MIDTFIFVVVLLPIILGMIVGGCKGRFAAGFFLTLLFLWLGLIVVFFLEDHSGGKCPECGGWLHRGYTRCPQCGHVLNSIAS